MNLFYILDEHELPIPDHDMQAWSDWMETHRIVEQTVLDGPPPVKISTIFLGINQGDMMLWETMIFGGAYDHWQDRHSTAADARLGHALAVAMAKGETTPEAIAEMKESVA